MSLKPKYTRETVQSVRIIVKNKNIQALMTKQFIWSFSNSLLSLRNTNIVTQVVAIKIGLNCLDPDLDRNKHRINLE